MEPQLKEVFRVFARIGLMSFGGPAAQIAVMHRELVEERPWLSEEQFLRALSFCMFLPGPEAMQLCTYAGWRLRGTLGGLIAGLLFVLPGALVMLFLAWAYAKWGTLSFITAMFLGIKATVIVVVIQALWKLAAKTLKQTAHQLIAAIAFLALFIFNTPFPLVIALAALYGALSASASARTAVASHRVSLVSSLRQALIWLSLWGAPIGIAVIADAPFLTDVGLFFSKLAVVTFGGAYAVLAYMAQDVVTGQNWLSAAQMIDGLGLAETTPGPLILVTEFVGYMAGHNKYGTGMAVLAAIMTLWVTFTPCFLWIFAAAPHVEWLTSRPRLTGALSSITAAVVGVIANLSLWFALHVFFDEVTQSPSYYSAILPVWNSANPTALLLAALAAFLLLRLKIGLPIVLATMAAAGFGMSSFA